MALPTKERLAQALHAAGLFELERRARDGAYDDVESKSATPKLDLHQALVLVRHEDLADRVMAGEWDNTPKEAEA